MTEYYATYRFSLVTDGFLLKRLGECTFFTLGAKGLNAVKLPHWSGFKYCTAGVLVGNSSDIQNKTGRNVSTEIWIRLIGLRGTGTWARNNQSLQVHDLPSNSPLCPPPSQRTDQSFRKSNLTNLQWFPVVFTPLYHDLCKSSNPHHCLEREGHGVPGVCGLSSERRGWVSIGMRVLLLSPVTMACRI